MISDFLGGTSQNEVMGVGIANDHALRSTQGVPPMIQSFRLQSYSNCIIIAHSHSRQAGSLSYKFEAIKKEPNAFASGSFYRCIQ